MPTEAPDLSRGLLWYRKADGLLYTGVVGQPASFAWDDTPAQAFALWSYRPSDGSWNFVLSGLSSRMQPFRRPDQSLDGFADDVGFALNGVDQFGTRIDGLLEVDLGTKMLSNGSMSTGFGSRIYHGRMQFVPIYGKKGIMIPMGGQLIGDTWADMSIIHVYDILSKTFHNQTATGNIPTGRADYCVAGAASTNNTYEIFFYGGFQSTGNDSVQFDTIHILSLPAFHWIQVNYPPSSPRSSHTCTTFHNTAQIISHGGTDPAASGRNFTQLSQTIFSTADPRKQGLGIFNLTSLTWKDSFDPNAPPYVQSDPIKQYYAQAGQ